MIKRILITGATDGIGKETAKKLAGYGHDIIIHGRHGKKLEKTRDLVKNEIGNRVSIYQADFSSLDQVKKMAADIRSENERIDVLINNAGLYSSHFKTSDEGIELTYAVNHLAPFLLSLQLLDLVKKSNDGRVITVSSMMHSSASSYLPFNTAKDYNGSEAYSRSKYANVLFTYKLARELKDTKTKSNCLHPGAINTKLLKAAFGPFGKPVNQGAETPVFLAHDTRAKKYNGKYFKDKRPVRSAPETYDKSKQDDLWEKSIELVKNYLP